MNMNAVGYPDGIYRHRLLSNLSNNLSLIDTNIGIYKKAFKYDRYIIPMEKFINTVPI